MFGLSRFVISGHSMEPAFRPGERVLVWKGSKGNVGDVVAFSAAGKVMVKRVAAITKKIELRGDNKADSKDFSAEKKDIIGKVLFKY